MQKEFFECEHCNGKFYDENAYHNGIDDDGYGAYDMWLCELCALAAGHHELFGEEAL